MILSIIALVAAIASAVFSAWMHQRTDRMLREYRADMAVIQAIKRGAERRTLFDIYELHGVDSASDRVAYYWQHYGSSQ